ncbi:Serine/threonine phosphatase stp [Planctomycetes bacterium CA13]|uniref:Serine/threonine phosphatase stp n=1 Tax=Novipirellula herctigrandis TaxID=2527986 RepID=A0A5C5YW35_9BACT|nr:Serine/threonine phosphatase stp [Planctomycetes bacterium CA13]
MSDKWKSGIAFSQLTDVGMRRANNQDSLACLPASSGERFADRGHLFVVADGMGAHAAGEMASRIATDHIAMQYFRSIEGNCAEALRVAVEEANIEIFRRGQQNPEFYNMGTTASSLVLLSSGALIAHVGDSRIYRLRNGVLEQLTFDHSLVWEFEASGQMEPGSVLGQAIPKNVITRSLGPNDVVNVDIEGPFPIQVNDCFLLCSDGLSGQVEDEEIATLLDCLPEDLAARVLVDLANLRGGPDNSTVIIVRVDESFTNASNDAKPSNKRQRNSQSAVSPLLIGTVVSCFLGAAVLGGMAAFGVKEALGPMVVAIILGLISVAVCLVQYFQSSGNTSRKPLPQVPGGKGPYRRYNAQPTKELFERLGQTVEELREAANQRNWLMDWRKIDELKKQSAEALANKDSKAAIRLQAERIIETMHQLRELNNRAANETAIDH